jgi:cytochrome c-type biogenesis protein CcmH
MSRLRSLLLAFLLLAGIAIAAPVFSAGSAIAAPVPDSFADPAMEARAHNLQRQLRCPVCKGQSIDESGADLATDLRRRVRELMAEGRSDDQIKAYLRARYGDFILMQPPLEPSTWLLWVGPFLVLGIAGGVAWRVISRARKAPESTDFPDISNL